MGTNLVKPKTLVLACADANGQAVKPRLDEMGLDNCAGRKGVYTWNLCEPNCAASNKWGRTSADFGLGDAVHARQGWLFEQLTVHITGANWHETRTWTLSEKPIPSNGFHTPSARRWTADAARMWLGGRGDGVRRWLCGALGGVSFSGSQ